jgi:hypothetical protein
VKGDIARALFYMATRYIGDVGNEPALHLTDTTAQITSTTNFMGRLNTLLRWSQSDAVDAAELLRNDRVYSYQTNRNPFVDHPEWVAKAFIPSLNIVHGQNVITLIWTNDGPTMSPEQSTALNSAWAPVTNTLTLTPTNTWFVALSVEPGARFFRLRLK